MSKHFSFPSAAEDRRRQNSVEKARNRGKVAEEWFKAGNALTPATIAEFNKLMKQADKEFDLKPLSHDR